MERMNDHRRGRDYARGDYGYDSNRGYDRAYDRESTYQRSDRAYSQPDYAYSSRDYERGMGSDGDYRYGGYIRHDNGYDSTGYGAMMYNPYANIDGTHKLSQKDIKKWEKKLENADGTRGAKYDVQQLMPLIQQAGIHFEEFTPELFTAIVNMMYSDYCKVFGTDPMTYIKMAKAFLDDDDFSGEPAEKAMLYYKCIVEKDE